MIRRILALFTRPAPEPVVDMADLIIAKRAAECRRSESVATSYRAVHTNLKAGLRK